MPLLNDRSGQALQTAAHWNLNELQTAFFNEDDHCLCVACPGAGKTRTVIAKVARLCAQSGPTSVIAITFTRAGAKELRDRIANTLPPQIAKGVKAYTFHGLAFRQLLSRQELKLLSAADQHGLMARAKERVGTDIGLEKLTEAVSTYQRTLEVKPPPEDAEEYVAYRVYLEYRNAMAAHGAMDMDDLMRNCLTGYRSGQLRPLAVKAMLVDEFQDIDEIQLNIILEYAKRGTKIHVVGDDDQSIYAFRSGLGHKGMMRFAEAVNAKTCFLDTNYRCAAEIVASANRVIQQNSLRIEKQLLSGNTSSATILLHAYPSSIEEAEAIAVRYQTLQTTSQSMVVLARTNNWLDTIELAAISRDIPVKRIGDQGFLNRKHVANVISAIKLGLYPNDRLALVASLHSSNISIAAIARLEEQFDAQSKDSLLELLYDVDVVSSLEKQDATLLREFRLALTAWMNQCEQSGAIFGSDGGNVLNIELAKLLQYFSDHAKNEWQRQDIATLGKIVNTKLSGSLRSRIKTLDGWARRSRRSSEIEGKGLTLMTVHAAKGLEFDVVWVAGCNERVFPYEKCDVEEERRLFYVAMTRARTELRMSYIAEGNREPSRFTVESGIPLNAIEPLGIES